MNPYIALAVQISIEPPTLDFDITMVIQVCLFVLVMLFLNKYVLKPCLRSYEAREALTTGAASEASALKKKADEAQNEYITKRQAAFAEIETERKNAIREAQNEQAAKVSETRAAVQKDIAARQAAFDASLAEARATSAASVEALSNEIANKLLA